MRRPKVTVRRMMFVIAALALVLGGSIEGIRLKRKRDEYLKIAATHAQFEAGNRQMQLSSVEMVQSTESFSEQMKALQRSFPGRSPRFAEMEKIQSKFAEDQKAIATRERQEAAKYASLAEYHGALKGKYLRAGARPWISVEPDPPPPDAAGRGRFWAERGRYIQARTAYEEAIRLDPEDFSSLNDLAWALATCPDADFRDGAMAVELATRACELTVRTDPSSLDTLAAAYAEAGDFKAAVKTQTEAIGNLPTGDPLLAEFQDRLKLYEAGQAYRVEVSHKPE
jgi:tetratricopeptide (TPR) repeat protein